MPRPVDVFIDVAPISEFETAYLVPPCSPRSSESLRVLIAAPKAATRSTAIGLLHGFGCRIYEAETVRQAMAIHAATPADLILFDYSLPLVAPIRWSTPRQPVIVAMAGKLPNPPAPDWDAPDEWLLRPLQVESARARIDRLVSEISARIALADAEHLLLDLAQTVEDRVPGMYRHCQRVAELALRLGQRMGLCRDELWVLHRAAYLHDLGKLFLPPELLRKPGLLTQKERELIEQHVIHGEQVCRSLRSLAPVLPLIRHHHERFDGGGYPDALAGEEIPLLARVLQAADIYDVLTHGRPYRSALSPSEAQAMLAEEAGRGWRDPHVVSALESLLLQPD